MKYSRLIFGVVLLLITAASCVTPKEVDYLQDVKPNRAIPLNGKFEAVVAPYDQLTITVMGFGVEKELAEPFNRGFFGQNGITGNNNLGYLVDVNGDIQFPTLGQLHVQGLTRLQLQDMIRNRLIEEKYMNNPMVDVRFTNFRIFVLGTADGGTVLTIPNERCTFLEALAMMGGLNKFTKRDKIAVIREIDGEMVTRYLDPRSAEVFNDPFFLLQQNDIIVTQSHKRVFAQETVNTTLSIVGTAASVVSTLSIIYLLITQGKLSR